MKFKIPMYIAIGFLGGCKLLVMSPPGGDITWNSGAQTCAGGSVCEVAIDDASFSESFTASPKPGYEFVRWVKASSYRCGDLTSPTCTITLAGDAAAQAAVDSYAIIHIAPVYEDVGIDTDGDGIRNEEDEDDDNDGLFDVDDLCPLVGGGSASGCLEFYDTVYIPDLDQEWVKVNVFSVNLAQLNTICPSGVCSGAFQDYEMNSWNWADPDTVNALFNYYIGPPVLGPGPDSFGEIDSLWAPAFSIEWTGSPCGGYSGWQFGGEAALIDDDCVPGGIDRAVTTHPFPPEADLGVWLYR